MRQRRSALRRKLAEHKKLSVAWPRALRIIKAVARDSMSVEEATRRIRQIAPDKNLRGQMSEFFARLEKPRSPQEIAAEEKELKERRKALDKKEEINRAVQLADRGLTALVSLATKGDHEAIDGLVTLAIDASTHVLLIECALREATRTVARKHDQWPVLIIAGSNFEAKLRKRIDDLQLSQDLPPLRSRFRQARGADMNYPARCWAQAAVRTLEETRLRVLLIVKEKDAYLQLCVREGWQLSRMPGWVMNAMNLEPFSARSHRTWSTVIREMIRQQMPDFHTHADWATQRNTAKQSGRDSKGEIQNAILDDIGRALKTIAPLTALPKLTC